MKKSDKRETRAKRESENGNQTMKVSVIITNTFVT